MDWEVFFRIHDGSLPREGPGDAESLAWAVEMAEVGPAPRVLDAGCGPGADIGPMLELRPAAAIRAVDKRRPFVDAVAARWGNDPRVTAATGDMTAEPGPFDLIWCAGAAYIPGLEAALAAWSRALASGGALAFSEPAYFTETPSAGAIAFWEGADVRPAAAMPARLAAAGWTHVAGQRLSDAAWEAYYQPIEARARDWRPGADPTLAAGLDRELAEAARWRAVAAETGYLVTVARR